MQTNSYTSAVNLSLMNLRRCVCTSSFLAVLSALLNTTRKLDREYSYMLLIDERPLIAKKRMAPRLAQDL